MLSEWNDIMEMYLSDQSMRDKYTFYYNALNRLCTQRVSDLTADYGDFFSRLQAVCRLTNYRLFEVDRFRWRARRIIQGEQEPDEILYSQDVRTFIDAYAHFSETEPPTTLIEAVKNEPREIGSNIARNDLEFREKLPHEPRFVNQYKHMRFSAFAVDEFYIYAMCKEMPREDGWKIDVSQNQQTISAAANVEEGMQLNAVNFSIDDENGIIRPELIILNPDYIVDVTSICRCMQPYGITPLNHLLDKFRTDELTSSILLGNVANQFLDDCINDPSVDYNASMRKAFKDYLIGFTTCKDIDLEFFTQCKQQFANIHKMVDQMYADPNFVGAEGNVELEPSFFCEALGIQGRCDFLQGDLKNVVELKSGKWDEYHNKAKDEHIMQMILYKEILYHNLGIRTSSIGGYLFYSKYPKLQEQRTAREMVQAMMMLRNGIVILEQQLKDGKGRELLSYIQIPSLRLVNMKDEVFNKWYLPQLKRILDPIESMDELTADYFYTFLQFIEKEQYLSRVGDGRLESTRGMASLWNAELATKKANGDILTDLRVVELEKEEGIKSVTLLIPDDLESQPNFRIGDAVVLYQRNNLNDSAVTKQVVRCSVEDYGRDTIKVQLRYQQRSDRIFDRESLFAIEHDYLDSSSRSQYAGLHSLLTVSKERRDLLLCQRKPESDSSVELVGKYMNPQIDEIVLKAKQAKDYFLLVGPPGTGKTSVALRSMIEEFSKSGKSLLLLSYTNRAVDEICGVLEGKKYIRIGKELACGKQYHPHLINNIIGEDVKRDDVKRLIEETNIFVSTVTSMTSNKELFHIKQFDVAIFDEASQILEPQLLPLLCAEEEGQPAIRKFIMIGDHKQLPAVVVQNEESSRVDSPLLQSIGLSNCRNSLFERLANQTPECVMMLDHQGRMHPDIADFASREFYDGLLKVVPVEHQTETTIYKNYDEQERFAATTRLGFIDVPLPPLAERQPKMNLSEARSIALLVGQLYDLYEKNIEEVDNPCEEGNENTDSFASKIGIIVPFRRQIVAVRHELVVANIPNAENIMIDTVERYQGSQRDIVIYGTTITRQYELDILSNVVEQSGIQIDRKLNVAITRARKQLFVFGNRMLLSRNPIYKRLIEAAKSLQ